MQLHFLQAVVPLLFVVHVEDLKAKALKFTLMSFKAMISWSATRFALNT
jgi:hypothetical protein